MDERAFLIAGDSVAIVANDGADARYGAATSQLPVGGQTAVASNPTFETQIVVAEGIVEIMIGGASAIAFEGDFARVPPGAVYACRNAGEEPAVLLTRIVSSVRNTCTFQVHFGFAA